jgi:hypothetical protein
MTSRSRVHRWNAYNSLLGFSLILDSSGKSYSREVPKIDDTLKVALRMSRSRADSPAAHQETVNAEPASADIRQ